MGCLRIGYLLKHVLFETFRLYRNTHQRASRARKPLKAESARQILYHSTLCRESERSTIVNVHHGNITYSSFDNTVLQVLRKMLLVIIL
jgi:hypothetical protein